MYGCVCGPASGVCSDESHISSFGVAEKSPTLDVQECLTSNTAVQEDLGGIEPSAIQSSVKQTDISLEGENGALKEATASETDTRSADAQKQFSASSSSSEASDTIINFCGIYPTSNHDTEALADGMPFKAEGAENNLEEDRGNVSSTSETISSHDKDSNIWQHETVGEDNTLRVQRENSLSDAETR